MINGALFSYFNSFAGVSSAGDALIVFCADTLGLIILFGLVIFLFSHVHKRQGFKNVIVVLVAGFLAWSVAALIKYLFPSPRPFIALPDARQLVGFGFEGVDSFPSAHAAFFSALAVATYFYHKELGVFLVIAAFLIGVGRIAAGVHWPIDVLVGYLLGVSAAFCSYYSVRVLLKGRR